MKVASQPPTLLFTRGYQTLTRTLEVCVETNRMNRRACVLSEVLEQALVGSRKRPSRRLSDNQVGNRLAVVDEGQPSQRATARVALGGGGLDPTIPIELNGRVLKAQRLEDRVDDRLHDPVRRKRPLQPLAEPGEGCVGIGAITVDPMVGASLESHPQRLNADRDQTGRKNPSDSLMGEQGTKSADDGHVCDHDGQGQRPVNQGPVDGQLDIEQAVPEDPDRDGRWDRDQHRQKIAIPVMMSAGWAVQRVGENVGDERKGNQHRRVGEPEDLQPLDARRMPETASNGEERGEQAREHPNVKRDPDPLQGAGVGGEGLAEMLEGRVERLGLRANPSSRPT